MEIRKYWDILYRRKNLFLLTMGGVVTLTLIWALSATHIYQATTKVMIKTQDMATVINSTVSPTLGKLDFTTYSYALGTVIEIMNTNESMNRMIQDLGLIKKNGKPFSGIELLNAGLISLSMNQFGVRIKQMTNSDVIAVTGFSKYPELAVKMSEYITDSAMQSFINLNRDVIRHVIVVQNQQISRIGLMVSDVEETIRQFMMDQEGVNIDEKIESYTTQLVSTELSLAGMLSEKQKSHPNVKQALEQIAHAKKELKAIPGKQIELDRLERLRTALNQVHSALIGDLEKARLMEELSISNLFVVEKAKIPDAIKKYYIYFPKKKLMMMFSVIVGFFLGLTVVFFVEYLDDTIKNPNQLHAWTGQPVFAAVPEWNPDDPVLKTAFPFMLSAMSDLWLSMMLDAKKQKNGREPKVVSVTSYGRKEGKTFVAMQLGLLLSNIGFKTLVVDLNFTHPVSPEIWKNWQPSVDDEPSDWYGAIQRTGGSWICRNASENLAFLHAVPSWNGYPTSMENSFSILNLIKAAEKHFDKIVMDLSALDKCRYPLFFAHESDSTLLIVQSGKYPLENIQWSIRELMETGISSVGLVLNKYKFKPDIL